MTAAFILKCLQKGVSSASAQEILNQGPLGLIYLEYKIPLLSCLVIFGAKNRTPLDTSKLVQQLEPSGSLPSIFFPLEDLKTQADFLCQLN